MRKLTQIIRLHFDAKLSTRPIAKSLGLSVGVVNGAWGVTVRPSHLRNFSYKNDTNCVIMTIYCCLKIVINDRLLPYEH